MKKYLSILAIFAVAAVACNKVEPQAVEETPEVVSGTNTVSFRANLPAFGVESKATISNTGEFAWEEDDWIYVLAYSKSKNSLWHVPFKYNTTTQQFTCDFPVSMYYIGGAENVQLDRVATLEEAANAGMAFALYPDPQGSTTEVAYDRVQKLFKMEGNLNSSGEIEFVHKSAMVNVHIANVPSFASYFTVAGGAETVKVVNLGDISSIDKAVPVTPTGSASDIVITLYDSANNVIISKKKSGKTLVAGTLYDTPVITVGRVLKFTCEDASWTGQSVHIWENGGSGTYDFKSTSAESSAEYPWKLNELSAGVFYAVLNSVTNLTWATEGAGIGVQFTHGTTSSQTDCFYLYRDGDFTLPSAGGMKTAYRCYARFSDSQWGYWKNDAEGNEVVKFNGYWFSNGEDNKFANWVDCERTTPTSTVFYYVFPEDYYGYGNIGYKFYNPVNTGWNKGNTEAEVLNKDFMVEF